MSRWHVDSDVLPLAGTGPSSPSWSRAPERKQRSGRRLVFASPARAGRGEARSARRHSPGGRSVSAADPGIAADRSDFPSMPRRALPKERKLSGNTFTPWDKLTPELQDRLRWAVRSCEEYESASRFLWAAGVAGSPLGRFIESGRYVYVAGYFHFRDGALRVLLADLGWKDLLATIEKRLTKPLGPRATFGDLLAVVRNKIVAHPSFDLDMMRTELRRVYPGINDAVLAEFTRDVADLFDVVEMTVAQIRKCYPEAMGCSRRV